MASRATPPSAREWSPRRSTHFFRMLISVVGLGASMWIISASPDVSLRSSCFGVIGLIVGYWLR